jgi:hypothetical protein
MTRVNNTHAFFHQPHNCTPKNKMELFLKNRWEFAKHSYFILDKKSAYIKAAIHFAKKINPNHPLSVMMPGVHFDDNALNLEKYNNWFEAYLDDDLFLCETSQGLVANSVEYLHHYNASQHKYDQFFSLNGEPLSDKVMIQFIARLHTQHLYLFSEAYQCRKKIVEMKKSSITLQHVKYDWLFQELEKLLLLSFTSAGLTSTFDSDFNLHNILSAYAYEQFNNIIQNLLTTDERDFLSTILAKRLDGNGTKSIGEIMEDAFTFSCTSTLGLYWLGLINEYRPQSLFNVNVDIHTLQNHLEELGLDVSESTLEFCIKSSRNALIDTFLNYKGQPKDEGDVHVITRFGY